MGKFILQLVITWITGTAFLLLCSELFVERTSREDLFGFTSYSLVYFLITIFLIYLPFFTLLKRKKVDSSKLWWIAPVLLNIPLYIVFYFLIDKAFRQSEAYLFVGLFFFFGAAFGWLYHRYMKYHAVLNQKSA
jgi:hypothetical protein